VKKRLLKVAIASALTVAFAVPAFANPFSDVPAKHWAYDAVNQLAQAGLVDGYGDGTFRGDKTMTRYEMAQIVAKAMDKNLNADQKEVVDRLSQEFGAELNNLGVKVAGLEKKVDNMVKVSGDARVRYGAIENEQDTTDFRARIAFNGKINDDLKFGARLTSGNVAYDTNNSGNVKLDTANVSFNALGLNNTIGRQDVKLGSGLLADTQMNAVATQLGNMKLVYGNWNSGTTKDRAFAAEYKANILGATLTADYLKNEGIANSEDKEIYGASASFGLIKGVTANAEYFKNNDTDATATAYGVKFNKLGLSVMHRDVEEGMITNYSNLTSDIQPFATDASFKGMEYQLDRNVGKNAVLTVKHQDFDDMNARTSAYVNVKF
jgi:hypothetical protein